MAESNTNTLAIIGLICAFIFPLAGLILGIIALVQIKKNPTQSGKGLAIAAIVISAVLMIIGLLIALFALIFYIGILPVIANQPGPIGTSASFCSLATTSITCSEPEIEAGLDNIYFKLTTATGGAFKIKSASAVPAPGNPATGTCIAVEKDDIGYIWNIMYIPVYENADITLSCPDGSLSGLTAGEVYDWDLILETYPEDSDASSATTSYGTLSLEIPYPAVD